MGQLVEAVVGDLWMEGIKQLLEDPLVMADLLMEQMGQLLLVVVEYLLMVQIKQLLVNHLVLGNKMKGQIKLMIVDIVQVVSLEVKVGTVTMRDEMLVGVAGMTLAVVVQVLVVQVPVMQVLVVLGIVAKVLKLMMVALLLLGVWKEVKQVQMEEQDLDNNQDQAITVLPVQWLDWTAI